MGRSEGVKPMISVTQCIQLMLAFCAGISCLGAALAYIARAIGWIRKPEQTQNDMLKDHEKRIKNLEDNTQKDYSEIERLQDEMKLVLRAVVAIMRHELDGNNTKDMAEVQHDISEYLIKK